MATAKRIPAKPTKKAQAARLGPPPARATRAAEPEGYASAGDFKKNAYTDLRLPSGKLCAAKRVGLGDFMASGNVPNSLMPMMKGALAGKKDLIPETIANLDPGMMADMFELFDIATVAAVVIPPVLPLPAKDDEGVRRNSDGTEWQRNPDLLYVDEIDLADRQFIFAWAVGGTSDIAKFRDETATLLADLQKGQGVGNSSKRAPRNR